MPPIQENQTLSFGSARAFSVDANGNTLQYPELEDVQIDVKTELKEAMGENNYAFAIVDSKRTIDISAKHYLLDAQGLADSLGGTLAANMVGYAYDEAHVVGEATSDEILLVQTAPLAISQVIVGVPVGSNVSPVYYVQTSGSPVAGVSYSLSGHTLTFASGDEGYAAKITYSYTAGSALGTQITVNATYQNSQAPTSLVCLRRDRSRVDGSTHMTAWEFAQIRDGGIKAPYKQGDYVIYERTFKAYANPMGLVLMVRQFNV